jgi:hypothetical protein
MAILSERAKQWLQDSNCFEEIADDMLTVANSGIQILLSKKAIEDLNRQARDAQES